MQKNNTLQTLTFKTLSGTGIDVNPGSSMNLYVDGTNIINFDLNINELSAKTTPDDADEFVIANSASSFSLKKLSFTNLKATLLAYFDTLYSRTSTIFGVGQTYQDLTASRAYGVTYTNTTSKPIVVYVNSEFTSSGSATLTINGVLIPETFAQISGIVFRSVAFGIVPPGGTYSATGNTLTKWVELR
jgi:hypothetical protein